jgi:hypothetical protein
MLRTWFAFSLVLLLAACSAVKVAYNQIDWALPLYVENQVTLDETQSQQLRERVSVLLRWHCETQVSEYAQWLREIGVDVQNGQVTAARLAAHHERILGYWQAIRAQAAPHLTELLATASDEQIEELYQSFARQNRKIQAEYVDRAETRLRNQAEETMRERIEDWIGDLTPVQQRAVADWSRRLALIGAERLAWRRQWQGELRQALAVRADHERFAAELQPLFMHVERRWSAAYQEKYGRVRDQTIALLAEIGNTLEPTQREHLVDRVDRWSEAMASLACATPTAPEAAATMSGAQ